MGVSLAKACIPLSFLYIFLLYKVHLYGPPGLSALIAYLNKLHCIVHTFSSAYTPQPAPYIALAYIVSIGSPVELLF